MSTVINEGVKMRCKAVTHIFKTVVGLLVEIITCIAKPKGPLEEYPSISKPLITVNYNSPFIPSSLLRSFFFRSTLITNGRIHHRRGLGLITVESEVINSYSLCVKII